MNTYAKWTGLAFQMLATIGLMTWLGVWLDGKTAMKFPVWTVCLSLTGVAASMVLVIKEVRNSENS